MGTTDSYTDFWNNEIGRRIGLGNGNIGDEVLKALARGDLSYSEFHVKMRGLQGKTCKSPEDDTSGSKDSSGSDSGASDSY